MKLVFSWKIVCNLMKLELEMIIQIFPKLFELCLISVSILFKNRNICFKNFLSKVSQYSNCVALGFTQKSLFSSCNLLSEKDWEVKNSCYFPPIFILGKKIHPLKAVHFQRLITNWKCLNVHFRQKWRFWMWNFKSLNYSKFALECNWNSKVSRNERNIVCFGKIDKFSKKNLKFCEVLSQKS